MKTVFYPPYVISCRLLPCQHLCMCACVRVCVSLADGGGGVGGVATPPLGLLHNTLHIN